MHAYDSAGLITDPTGSVDSFAEHWGMFVGLCQCHDSECLCFRQRQYTAGVCLGGGDFGTCPTPLATRAPYYPVDALDGETTFGLLRPQKDAVLNAPWTAKGVLYLFSVRGGRKIFVWGRGQGPRGPKVPPHPKSKTRRMWPIIFQKGPNEQTEKKTERFFFKQSQRALARPERAHPRDHPRPDRAHPRPDRAHPRSEKVHLRFKKDHPRPEGLD